MWLPLKKCVSMKWSTKQTAADFSLHVSVHAAPRLKLLCSTHWQSVWITNPTRKRVLGEACPKCCPQNKGFTLGVSHGRPWKTLTPKAAFLLAATEASKTVSFRFTLARYVSLNYLTYPTAGQHPISAVLLTQSFHLVTSRALGNLRKSRAIILSLSFASPAAFPLNHPLCHRTRRGDDDAAGSGGARLTGWIASVCCCGWQREKPTAHARHQLSRGELSPDWSLVWGSLGGFVWFTVVFFKHSIQADLTVGI